ncbi:hypothetical protein [Kribbella sp. NPDC049227]|uniref:hypothetical protein n=1 Tax=Kribbella sp. NPDC049227 TaxID=3364113 RepID=UPI0037190729
MAHVFLCLVISAGVVVPVTRLLMWRAWLKFNLKIIESQSDSVDTSKIAESFLRPVFMRGRRLPGVSVETGQERLDRGTGEQS